MEIRLRIVLFPTLRYVTADKLDRFHSTEAVFYADRGGDVIRCIATFQPHNGHSTAT